MISQRAQEHAHAKSLTGTNHCRKICLLYLANDVVQQSRKKGSDFRNQIGKYLPGVYSDLHKSSKDKQAIDKAGRLLVIWRERAIYDSGFIARLQAALVSLLPRKAEGCIGKPPNAHS